MGGVGSKKKRKKEGGGKRSRKQERKIRKERKKGKGEKERSRTRKGRGGLFFFQRESKEERDTGTTKPDFQSNPLSDPICRSRFVLLTTRDFSFFWFLFIFYFSSFFLRSY